MPRIKPKTILPYIKRYSDSNTTSRNVNTKNALNPSEELFIKKSSTVPTSTQLVGGMHGVSDYVSDSRSIKTGHMGAIKRAWALRK